MKQSQKKVSPIIKIAAGLAVICAITVACAAAVNVINRNKDNAPVEDTGDTPDIVFDNESDTASLFSSAVSETASRISSARSSSSKKEDTDTETEEDTSTEELLLEAIGDENFEYVNQDMLDYFQENTTPEPDVVVEEPTEIVNSVNSIDSSSEDDYNYEYTTDSEEVQSDTEMYVSSYDDTSSAEHQYPSNSVILDVPYYSQRGDMPTGCELISTKMVLAYLGHPVSNQDILNNLTRCDLKVDSRGRLYGRSPFDAFIGDPQKYTGFGCYPPVIVNMVNSMGFGDITIYNTSSQSLSSVAETYLPQGLPVLTWVTMGLVDSYWGDSWYLMDADGNVTDEKYTWRAQEHCMVLVGYDENYYYFNDPLGTSDIAGYDKSLVEKRYNEMGCYSLVLDKI